MGFLTVILAFTAVSLASAFEGCPSSSEISPCTCDREGMNCMAATDLKEISRAFRAKFKYGGIDAIWIQGTPITNIPADLFGKVKALKFYLEMNEIEKVDFRAFDSSKEHLRVLSFFGNKFTNFSYSSLEVYPELKTFNLGRNKLTDIPARAFSHQSLETVILSQNQIFSIGENAFQGLPNLFKLELSFNKLTTLGAYSISLSPHASGYEIYLNANSISYIHSTAFTNADPSVLYLDSNRMTSLKEEAFGSLIKTLSQSGGIISVSGNPFSCYGCDYRWILNNKYSYNRIIIGLVCPDRTGILDLSSFKIGC